MKSRRTAALYVVLALGFSLLHWLTVVLARRNVLPFSMEKSGWAVASVPGSILMLVLRGFGPAIAGVIALAVIRGRSAVVELGRSIVRWRVPGHLYLLGLFGIIVNAAVVIAGYATGVLHFALEQVNLPRFLLLFFLMALLDGPLGEEIGWRGVMLPQLLETFRPLTASLMVGVVWYAWHLPLYASEGRSMTGWWHVDYALTCVTLSIIFTWFFLKSNGSTFLAIYLHNCSNYFTFVRFKLFVKTGDSPVPRIAYLVVLLAIAIAAVIALWCTPRVGVPETAA